MPNRILKESICTNEQIDKLSPFDEIVFYRLIVNADDYGIFDGRPSILRSRLFPLKDIRNSQIENAIHNLASVELVSTYEVDGKPFVRLLGWERNQQMRARKSKYPGPDGKHFNHDTVCNHLKSDDFKCPRNPIQSESESKSESKSESNPDDRAREASNGKASAPAKPTRHKHGFYKNVLLSDEELEKLKAEFPTDWADRIERLSDYIESKGAKYKNHLATIRMWARKDGERNAKHGGNPGQSGNGTKPVLGEFL